MWRKHTCTLRGHFWPRRLLLFLRRPPAFVPSFIASQNGGGERKKWLPVHVRAVSPRAGAHWDHRAEARDTAGGPGRYTNTGHGAGTSAGWHRPRLWRLSRSERICPQNPHIPMFVTALVLESPPVVMEQVPLAPVVEYVTPVSAVTYAHASPVVEYVTPARTVACAAPVTTRTAATTVFPTATVPI